MSGAEALLRTLRGMGVEKIFASPGSDWAPLWEALAKLSGREDVPEYLSSRHEETAIAMASGYGKTTGKPRQRYRCFPEDGSTVHTFTPPLPREHVHEGHETAFYMLSGEELEMWTGDQLQYRDVVRPGDYLYIPANLLHVAVNRGNQPAVFVGTRNEPTAQESVVMYPEMDARVP